ncbi:MAG: TauD/TfdA family dioxygenase [Legionellaceae bacterium]|nr:TauD/TfdA family dioxygenase [Legionellaceae bacterium]
MFDIKNDGVFLTVNELMTYLDGIDVITNPLTIFKMHFDVKLFIECVKQSNHIKIAPSTDGVISHVQDNDIANALDHSSSSKYFGWHIDGQYLARVPEIVLLYCIDPGNQNIKTIFADSYSLIKILRRRELLDTAKEFDFIYRKQNEGKDYRLSLINKHPITGDEVIFVGDYSPVIKLVPKIDSNKTLQDAKDFHSILADMVSNELHYKVVEWESGQMIVFDNIRLLHGRGEPEGKYKNRKDPARHLLRIWLNRI